MVSTIALGADHAGYGLKEALKGWLINHDYQVLDLGTHSTESVDYPDYAALVAESVADHKVERGLLVCGTGIGMSIAANKVPGVRAAVCYDVFPAVLTREHNDSNVLCTGGWMVTPQKALEVAIAWLEMRYAGGAHQARLDKIAAMERK